MFFLGISDQHEADRRESFGIQFFFGFWDAKNVVFMKFEGQTSQLFGDLSIRFCALPFWGRPAPLPQPRSDQTTSVIIRADFNIFNFRKLASPFPSLQGTFQKHFQLPNLPPLFQTFRHHQGHQGPQGPRFRQIFGLQIAPQWSHRHRD